MNITGGNPHCSSTGFGRSKETKYSKKDLRDVYYEDKNSSITDIKARQNYINKIKKEKNDKNFCKNLEFLAEKKPANYQQLHKKDYAHILSRDNRSKNLAGDKSSKLQKTYQYSTHTNTSKDLFNYNRGDSLDDNLKIRNEMRDDRSGERSITISFDKCASRAGLGHKMSAKRQNSSIPMNSKNSKSRISKETSADRNLKPSKRVDKNYKSHKKNAYSMPFHDPTSQIIKNLNLPITFESKKATMTPDISAHNSRNISRNISRKNSMKGFEQDISYVSLVRINQDDEGSPENLHQTKFPNHLTRKPAQPKAKHNLAIGIPEDEISPNYENIIKKKKKPLHVSTKQPSSGSSTGHRETMLADRIEKKMAKKR